MLGKLLTQESLINTKYQKYSRVQVIGKKTNLSG